MAIMSHGEKHRENRGPKKRQNVTRGKTALVQVHLHFPLCFRRCVLRLSCEGSFDRNTKTGIRNKICVFFLVKTSPSFGRRRFHKNTAYTRWIQVLGFRV